MSALATFVLKGRIVTMSSEDAIIEDGYLAIDNGRIAAMADSKADLPATYRQAPMLDTKGSIYPGLIDLHNHFVYNVLPLWVVPKRYDNRSQWPAHPDYKAAYSKPIKQVLAKYKETSQAVIRYVEAKALIGGTTTGQGILTQVNGTRKIFQGAMRNVEAPGSGLKRAGTRVPDLTTTGASGAEQVESFRRALANTELSAYFYHLSEGVDDRSRTHFLTLKELDLIGEKLVGIHALGLTGDDFREMRQQGAKVVWSPFSNQLLYGSTIDLPTLKSSRVLFSVGCDWTPSGSKNLLQELKVAQFVNAESGHPFSDYDLVAMATSKAAAVTGWEQNLGTLEKGKIADLLVIKGKGGDPYAQLIGALEGAVGLVVVDGVPRYGEEDWMSQLVSAASEREDLKVDGVRKALYLFHAESEINDVSLKEAMRILKKAMNDLPGYEGEMKMKVASGFVPEEETFTLLLDNEVERLTSDDLLPEAELKLAALVDPPMATSVELDSLTVADPAYWTRIEQEANLPPKLIAWLKDCYGRS